MMSWFGRLFGTKKAIDSIVDKDNGLLSQVGGGAVDSFFRGRKGA